MKRILPLLILVTSFLHSYSLSDKFRMGLAVSPGIAWSNPFGKDLLKGNPRFGVSYGFLIEYWFAKNYGFASGIGGAYDGCNIHGRSRFEEVSGVKVRNVTEKYTFHYIEIPAYLKMKTNDIKESKFCVWGQVGATINVTVSARATYTDSISTSNGNVLIEKENILKGKNEIANSISNFRSNGIDVRLGVGGGFEYRFDKRTSLLVGLFYHNGFINNIFDHDAKKEANVMRFMSMRVGVLF